MTVRTRVLIFSVACVLAAPAKANLSVYPMRLPIHTEHGGQIRVYSQTPKVQYVQTRVTRLLHPATAQEQEVNLTPGELEGIAVTPGKFVLGGGGNRLVRVIPLSPVSDESAYRVYFEAVRPPVEVESDAESGSATASVGVSLVWGALVSLIPVQPVADMRVDGAALHNIGNVRLGVMRVEDCDASGNCHEHTVEHSVYPGETLTLPFTADPGHHVRVHYRLSQHGVRLHMRELAP
ncbi:pilus assembly protein [Stenotrophomonas sp. HMWF022]|uniref:fimbrial protein TcfA n=1 Tax=Stenotrophomonas sp. HMWF023 TaxID=2056859 RepID=UPI000D3C89C8|nr:fimbrial protein TcfA [Stenotrophomonas sp. HMWF023]PTS80401.1 pilus assembly protein [Stenotrophomonas sp. HMWF023]PTT57948.1 pilus assembly protein [Stenotrophomonas sp. HMWF022]